MINNVFSVSGSIEISIILTGDFNMAIINWTPERSMVIQQIFKVKLEIRTVRSYNCHTRINMSVNQLDLEEIIFLAYFYQWWWSNVKKWSVTTFNFEWPSSHCYHYILLKWKWCPLQHRIMEGIRSLNFSDKRSDWLRLDDAINTVDWEILILDKIPNEICDLF